MRTISDVIKAANPGFCAFVLALAVVVDAVTRHGLGRVLRDVVPSGTDLPALLAVAFIAAVLANLSNNLPATLALVPVVLGNPPAALAMLLGVNIGPNATYAGSLATLLWRRSLPAEQRPRARQFHVFGLLTVPIILLFATLALWLALKVIGV
jgi:arsenical pump membrane protein